MRGTILDQLNVWTSVKGDFAVDMNDVWRMVIWKKTEKVFRAELDEMWRVVMGWKAAPNEEGESDVEAWSVGSFEERKDALDPDRLWSERVPFADIGSGR